MPEPPRPVADPTAYPAYPDPEEPPYEARPRYSGGDRDVPLLANDQLARLFFEIGDMMELKGELVFKAVAYRRAADAIAHAGGEVAQAYREGRRPRLAGVGKAIDEKLVELADTGRLRFYERLRREVPPTLMDLLAIPGLGPRTVKELHDRLGVTTLEELATAARSGRLRELRGMSERAEQRILEGIASLERRSTRMKLGRAAEVFEGLVEALGGTPGLVGLTAAGSFRRRRETIGDLDLLAETERPAELIERFTALPSVERVIARGTHKATVQLRQGPQVDLMVMPPGRAGSYLVHFTGSKEHNVRLRGLARDIGWSLSENGFVRLGPDGKPLRGKAADLQTSPDEAGVYRFLGLPWMAPELREDEGEIEAAREGRLPALLERADLQGDVHSHSDWTDGRFPIAAMAEAARRRGLAWLALTDHTRGLAIARGMSPQQVEAQRAVVAELNARFEREEAEGRAPAGSHADGFRLLHGCELEIRADGRLDYPDELLARFDVVVASLHVGRRQSPGQLLDRYATALRNRHVDVIAHPSGRKIGERDDLDLDWDELYRLAAGSGTWLEINGADERLDLEPRRIRRAKAAGVRFAIASDAHLLVEFGNLDWAVAMARRGWLEPADVVNSLSRSRFLAELAEHGDRRG